MRDQGQGESTVSRMRLPVASELVQGHVDPLGLGPRLNLGRRPPSPRGPPPNPTQRGRPGPWVRCYCSRFLTPAPSGRG